MSPCRQAAMFAWFLGFLVHLVSWFLGVIVTFVNMSPVTVTHDSKRMTLSPCHHSFVMSPGTMSPCRQVTMSSELIMNGNTYTDIQTYRHTDLSPCHHFAMPPCRLGFLGSWFLSFLVPCNHVTMSPRDHVTITNDEE